MRTKEKASKWQKTTTPYLFKHSATGRYYVRIRTGGKEALRVALKTEDYSVAKNRLPAKIAELRANAAPRVGEAPATLWDALRAIAAKDASNPALKARSRNTYARAVKLLNPAKPYGVPAIPISKLTARDAEAWWARAADHYAPAMANYLLIFFKRAWKHAIDTGAVVAHRDLSKKLKRIKVPRTKLNVISKEQFAALLESVRKIPINGAPAAEWMEFVAYTGTRPEEAWHVTWECVQRPAGMLLITGGDYGTKNHETRRIPILPALADLLERIAARTERTTGRVLSVRVPRDIIRSACDSISIPKMTRYDFRHLFATRCNEAGVDVPTFAKWLGHKDGGALAMRTYVHPGEDHERQSALKVRF